MPPSGYNGQQASSIEAFLESISDALITEAQANGIGPVEALLKECKNIDAILKSDIQKYQADVLSITREFYFALLDSSPSDFDDFRRYRTAELDIVRDAILGIHVPETDSRDVISS